MLLANVVQQNTITLPGLYSMTIRLKLSCENGIFFISCQVSANLSNFMSCTMLMIVQHICTKRVVARERPLELVYILLR